MSSLYIYFYSQILSIPPAQNCTIYSQQEHLPFWESSASLGACGRATLITLWGLALAYEYADPGGIIGFEFFSLCANVIKIASTWSVSPSSLAEVSNSGMQCESANFCAILVLTAILSFTSHLLPTKIRGTSWVRLCRSHSSTQWGRFSKEETLVTS